VHFVSQHYIIVSKCTVQRTYKWVLITFTGTILC